MKKRVKKLMLTRETLLALDSLRLKHANGAATHGAGCLTLNFACGGTSDGGTGTTPTVEGTCYECSGGCATGGACTVTCADCTFSC